MKKIFLSALGATALTLGAISVSSVTTTAQAQKKGEPVILTVSMDQVIGQSKAGIAANETVESYRQSVVSELTAEQTNFQKEIEGFQKNQELWAADVRQRKEQELRAKQQQLPRMAQAMEGVVSQTVQKVRFDIAKEAAPIIENIAKKRKATVIIDRTATIYASTETDITQEVVSKLDKKISTVEIERPSLADLKKQAAEQAKNAGKQ